LKQNVDKIPPKRPIHNAPAGFVKIPDGAPTITPPARVAFKISSISNLSRIKDVVMNVPRQLPVKAIIVFEIMTLF
jgi:hypothetical protein